MRIAFVHEWLTSYTGAEKTLEAALECYPDAPIYTLVYHPENFTDSTLQSHPIHTSFIEKLPRGKAKYRAYLVLMPLAVEQFDLSDYDIIVSSSHAVAKGVITRGDQLHLSYTYTPIRYAWDLHFQYLHESGLDHGIRGWIARLVLHYIRLWDVSRSLQVDTFAAISNYVAKRIWKIYRRPARVIYPPVEIDRYPLSTQREDFYLTISRFVPYKKIDLIVEAFNRLELPLVIIGSGPDFEKIQRIAGRNVQLLGQQSTDVVCDYLQRCKAFVFAANEDFGIAPLEAQATGAPVIAFGKGGALETITPGTGLFFPEQTPESLMAAVKEFAEKPNQFDPIQIRQNAERFEKTRFQREFQAFILEEWAAFQSFDPAGYR